MTKTTYENSFGDMTEILEGLGGKWAALSEKDGKFSVAGSGDTIDEAIEEALTAGEEDPILMRVPLKNIPWILYNRSQTRREGMIRTLSIHEDDWDPLIDGLMQAGSRKKIETLLGLFVSRNWTPQESIEGKIQCHCCSTILDSIDVWSDCLQTGTLEGNRITDYSSPEVEETRSLNCPCCGEEFRRDNTTMEDVLLIEDGRTVPEHPLMKE